MPGPRYRPPPWRIALLALAVASTAAAAEAPEYSVKAAFVYNFAKFTEWPPETLAMPLTICVAGQDPFGAALSALEGRTISGRPLVLRRGVRLDDQRGCHVLFVPAGEGVRTMEWLRGTGHAMLTVGDGAGFVVSGGMIGLSTDGARVTFDVNLDAAQRAGLKISSHLLRLARTVKHAAAPEKP